MTEVVYLKAGQTMPEHGHDQPWLVIEASQDGLFFGTGAAFKSTGEWVGYGSLSENDVSLDLALAAARDWAIKYGVPAIWVQLDPS